MTPTEKRKKEHIDLCLEKDVSSSITTGFEDVQIAHNALPSISKNSIDTSCEFLGKILSAPIIITAMTGGTPEAETINKNLAAAAEELGLALGLGSERAAMQDKALWKTYDVRGVAPNIPLIANLGLVQFVKEYGLKQAKEAVEKIKADALAIHLNALQESVQPEGDTDFTNSLTHIKTICHDLGKPTIIKETGAGISREVATKLAGAGAHAIDVSGAGGTSFSQIELYRGGTTAGAFRSWGVPTACSVAEVARAVKIPVIASGGIRTGVDAAKAIALGAKYAGIALPLLGPAKESKEAVIK
ncbi:MAG: type 2 isopentenyl-diphosphate Delta-isomerase, partial [Candidatus Aenigmarchaeota archaeon]|nr:type 2 isopentenyl-diphosphate Delta-isomerase [Candidatus Aenigmarchaeota archaeon]